MRLSLEKTKRIEVPGDPDAGYINIKELSDEQLAAIEAQSSKISMTSGDDVSVSLNSQSRTAKVAKACLTGWGNMFDEKGKILKCTPANVKKASGFVVDIDGERIRFFAWIEKCHMEFKAEIEEELGAASEN